LQPNKGIIMRKEFEMTQADLDNLLSAMKPVPLIAIHCGMPRSAQENANDAWKELGGRLGFDPMTVQPNGKGNRFFTAEEVVPPTPAQAKAQPVEVEQSKQGDADNRFWLKSEDRAPDLYVKASDYDALEQPQGDSAAGSVAKPVAWQAREMLGDDWSDWREYRGDGLILWQSRVARRPDLYELRALSLYAAPTSQKADQSVSDAMVDAYLVEQRRTVEEADKNWGRVPGGGLRTNTVREACRNGITAALAAKGGAA
jgi:hypothetical protein